MTRVTVRMDEVLWQRACEAAAHDGRSLSQYVVESLELHLGRLPPDSEAREQICDGPATGSANQIIESASGDRIRDDL